MKKYIILFSVLALFSGCSDFLEEDTSTIMTIDGDVMQTEEGLVSAMAGMYKPMSYTWQSGYGNSSTQGVCMGSDDLTSYNFV